MNVVDDIAIESSIDLDSASDSSSNSDSDSDSQSDSDSDSDPSLDSDDDQTRSHKRARTAVTPNKLPHKHTTQLQRGRLTEYIERIGYSRYASLRKELLVKYLGGVEHKAPGLYIGDVVDRDCDSSGSITTPPPVWCYVDISVDISKVSTLRDVLWVYNIILYQSINSKSKYHDKRVIPFPSKLTKLIGRHSCQKHSGTRQLCLTNKQLPKGCSNFCGSYSAYIRAADPRRQRIVVRVCAHEYMSIMMVNNLKALGESIPYLIPNWGGCKLVPLLTKMGAGSDNEINSSDRLGRFTEFLKEGFHLNSVQKDSMHALVRIQQHPLHMYCSMRLISGHGAIHLVPSTRVDDPVCCKRTHYIGHNTTDQYKHYVQIHAARIVAGTGTGKTLMALLGMLEFCKQKPTYKAVYVTLPYLKEQVRVNARKFLTGDALELFNRRVKILHYACFTRQTLFYNAQTLVVFDESHKMSHKAQQVAGLCTRYLCITATPKQTNQKQSIQWPYAVRVISWWGHLDLRNAAEALTHTVKTTLTKNTNAQPVLYHRELWQLPDCALEALRLFVTSLPDPIPYHNTSFSTKLSRRVLRVMQVLSGGMSADPMTLVLSSLSIIHQQIQAYDSQYSHTKQDESGTKTLKSQLLELKSPTIQSHQRRDDDCVICWNRNPVSGGVFVQLEECGHVFCQQCLEHLVQGVCALCRATPIACAVPWFAGDLHPSAMVTAESALSSTSTTSSNSTASTRSVLDMLGQAIIPGNKGQLLGMTASNLPSGSRVLLYATNRFSYTEIQRQVGSILRSAGGIVRIVGYRGGPCGSQELARALADIINDVPVKFAVLVIPSEKYAEGLDLVQFDEEWLFNVALLTATKRTQCLGRLHRFGRIKPVNVRIFCSDNSLESYMVKDDGRILEVDTDSIESIVRYFIRTLQHTMDS
jgi:hypothetical protein